MRAGRGSEGGAVRVRARGMEWRRTYLDRRKVNGRVETSAVESAARGRAARAKAASEGEGRADE